jgi:3-methyladenine DNA glycosylase Tag
LSHQRRRSRLRAFARDYDRVVPTRAPKKIRPKALGDYLEVMTKAVFQSGMSWQVIEAKWDGFRDAFAGFDADKVAGFTPEDVDRLVEDTRIVRNRRKIDATVDNAVEMVALDREHEGFRNYLRSHGSFEETVADLKRHFRFLGDTGSYYFLHVVGEKVPPHDEWMASRR